MQDAGYQDVGRTKKTTPAGVNPRTNKSYGSLGFTVNSATPNFPKKSSSGGGSSRPSGSGGGGSYGGGGAGLSVGAPPSVGRNNMGRVAPIAPPKPPPAPPSLAQFLGSDSAYIQQQSALARALADYKAQQASQTTQYQNQYGLNLSDLTKQRTSAFGDLENDYASRGLLKSGVYGTAYSDLENDYKSRQTALDSARSAFLANQGLDLKNYQTEQGLTLDKAKQDAIARRAAKYGL